MLMLEMDDRYDGVWGFRASLIFDVRYRER
jgi:hypothetical protein